MTVMGIPQGSSVKAGGKNHQSVCRKSDQVFFSLWWRGLSFCCETELIGAYTIAERIRVEVESLAPHFGQTELPVTLSCGVAEFDKSETLGQFLIVPDQALSKQSPEDAT